MGSEHHPSDAPPPFWRSRYAIGLVVIDTVAGYFLLQEHLVHVAAALPYLFVLACPLMHVFMHRGHGHLHGSEDRGRSDSSDPKDKGDLP